MKALRAGLEQKLGGEGASPVGFADLRDPHPRLPADQGLFPAAWVYGVKRLSDNGPRARSNLTSCTPAVLK